MAQLPETKHSIMLGSRGFWITKRISTPISKSNKRKECNRFA